MSGLESMSALSEANAEADTRQKMDSPQLWRRLELYRLARSTPREDEQKRREMVLCLLKDVELGSLFVAADLSYQQTGDELKRRAVDTALISVFESSVGPELFQVRSFSHWYFSYLQAPTDLQLHSCHTDRAVPHGCVFSCRLRCSSPVW